MSDVVTPIRPMPPRRRSLDSIRAHYEIEKAIADQLRAADRDERRVILRTMYDVLFARVPDHPRLTARENTATTARTHRRKLALVTPYLHADSVLVEIAPGDCRFGAAVARHVRAVYGLDICDQRSPRFTRPPNFHLVLYDGFDIPFRREIADVVFSDQLLEHLHPDDVGQHVDHVCDLLRVGGVYVVSTPHRYSGPHDVSRHFSDEPQGFHLKEWTNRELVALLTRHGLRRPRTYATVRGRRVRVPFTYFLIVEPLLSMLPSRLRRRLATYLTPNIVVSAVKASPADVRP